MPGEKDKATDKGADKAPPKVKVERVHFHGSFYDSGVAKYEAGKHYPVTAETESQVKAGNAEIITVELDEAEHEAEHAAAHAALNHARRATHAAEEDARKRGLLK
jgi:hypothetical protein